jgi:predicted MFS family arabinose efflux permease
VLFGLVLLWLTMAVPIENRPLFFLLLCLTALFIPFSSPNIVSTVYDIALPEVRSTALSVQSFIEEAGTAVAPALAGFLAVRTSMHDSILWICTIAWLFCAIFLIGAVWFVPKDIETLRGQMKSRAEDLRPESA